VRATPGVLVLVTPLVLAACGLKADPVPPELVKPRPAGDLAAHSIPEGVKLTWDRPVLYTGGTRMNDLGGFDIHRAPDLEGPVHYVLVHTVELDDQTRFRKERTLEWVDTSVAVGESYRYEVTAFTLDGTRSKPAGPVRIRHLPPAAAEREGAKETR